MSWQDIQKKTFTKWANEHLKSRGMAISDLYTDLRDGIMLINLLEAISEKKVGPYNRNPRIGAQRLENQGIALNFIKNEGLKLVNIGPEDLCGGNPKLVLGLIWTLILRWQIAIGKIEGDNAKNELLKWVQSKIPEYNIKGFTKDWNDGRAVCALVDAIAPGSCPDHKTMNPGKGQENAQRGIDLAQKVLNIPPILDAADMANPRVDEMSVMTYIAYFRNAQPQPKRNDASRCRAFGPGLVEGVVNEVSEFQVEVPKDSNGKLEVKVTGPKTSAVPTVTKNAQGIYEVKFTPQEPGEWKVSVTLDGEHIPGSVFTVTVLEAISLGGEGKIRVYYSTTNKADKSRADVANLQKLLEKKAIHLRPDFEPWIPVDLMDKPDREAVFKKAGTRNLPIVFIDDVYTGDYDRCVELEGSGKLDQLLKFKERKNKR